jgi:hypothetical protein
MRTHLVELQEVFIMGSVFVILDFLDAELFTRRMQLQLDIRIESEDAVCRSSQLQRSLHPKQEMHLSFARCDRSRSPDSTVNLPSCRNTVLKKWQRGKFFPMMVFARTSRSFNKAVKTFTTCRFKVNLTNSDSICIIVITFKTARQPRSLMASDTLVDTCTFPRIAQTFRRPGTQSHSKAI